MNARRHICLVSVICILSAFTTGCSTLKAVSIVRSGEPAAGAGAEKVVPFDLKGHMILVKAKLNDSPKEYTFMVDTGALNAVREETAREIALEDAVEVDSMSTGGGTKKVRLARLARLSVGGMEVRECGTGVFDFSLIDQLTGVRLDGILGSNFLRHFRVTIDYRNRQLALARSIEPVAAPAGAYRLKFEQAMFSGFAPQIGHVAVGDTFLDALIDTGARESVISLAALEKIGMGGTPVIKAIGATGGGAFKLQDHNRLLRIDTLRLGPVSAKHLPVVAVEQRRAFEDKILLGKNFLDRYLVIIDYPADELILVPDASSIPAANLFSTGLTLKRDDEGAISVIGLWQGSPADRAGLAPGDRIVKVNGRDAAAFPLAEINDRLRDDRVGELDFRVKNGNGERSVVLRKEMLFPDVTDSANASR